MNEAARAKRFHDHLDTVLDEGGAPESVPEELREDVALAQRLAGTDFSDESRLRGRDPSTARRPRFASGHRVAAVLVVGVLAVAAAFAFDSVRVVRDWLLGGNTSVTTVDGDFSVNRGPDGEPVLSAGRGSDAIGLEPSGGAGSEALSFETAQAATDFRLRMPAVLPDGYRFEGVTVTSATEAQVAFLRVPPGAGLIGLLQRRASAGDAETNLFTTADIEVVPVTIDGRDALWMDAGEEGLLVWEADGVSYQLTGLKDAESALQVARSLR